MSRSFQCWFPVWQEEQKLLACSLFSILIPPARPQLVQCSVLSSLNGSSSLPSLKWNELPTRIGTSVSLSICHGLKTLI
uniref:Uncharacterized protein n=1 Tax=Anguilla anguilla TaxID=7936 RepID=A0A0E9WAY3_ANGAN